MSSVKTPTKASSPPLAVGQLRFVRGYGVALRVLALSDDVATVERLPGADHIDLPTTKELEALPLIADDGFCAGWMARSLNITAEGAADLAVLIWRDEHANDADRLRVRVLDDYMRLVRAPEEVRQEIRNVITKGNGWVRVGRGADLGYLPGVQAEGWRERWERSGVPVPSQHVSDFEQDAVSALPEFLPLLQPSALGRVVVCPWLPRPVRDLALAQLLRRWRAQDGRAAFRQVLDEAMARLLGQLTSEERRAALHEPALSLSSRCEVVQLLVGADPTLNLSELIGGSSARDPRTAAHLLVIAQNAEDRLLALTTLLNTSAPDDDEEGREVLRLARQGVLAAGYGAPELLLQGARLALQNRVPSGQVRRWTDAIGGALGGLKIATLLEALGTHAALRHEQEPLVAFAPSPARVAEMLHAWIERESAHEHQEAPDLFVSDVSDPRWANGVLSRASRATEAGFARPLLPVIRQLVEMVLTEQASRKEAEQRAVDPANAARVLHRERASQTLEERERLLDSTRDEVARERERERHAAARLVGEVLTALGRAEQARDASRLPLVIRRVTELAADFGMEPLEIVGAEVLFDPERHDARLQPGSPGRVIAPGIRGRSGQVLIRARLVPSSGADS